MLRSVERSANAARPHGRRGAVRRSRRRRSRPRSTSASWTAPTATTAGPATAATGRPTTCSPWPSGWCPTPRPSSGVVDSIAADVHARGDTLNTGVLGTKYLLPVLTEHGHADLAQRLATQTKYPSWGYMIYNGATSMWEHWALEARSRGHYFLGTVDDWYFHHVAGIRASQTTGYRDLTIAPAVTGELDWARATTPTPYGPVTSDWRNRGRTLELRVDVPVGATATVHVPAENAYAVTEGGDPVAEADGVHAVRDGGDTVLVTVGSGRLHVRRRRADGARRPRAGAHRRPRGSGARQRPAPEGRPRAAALARRGAGPRLEGAQAAALGRCHRRRRGAREGAARARRVRRRPAPDAATRARRGIGEGARGAGHGDLRLPRGAGGGDARSVAGAARRPGDRARECRQRARARRSTTCARRWPGSTPRGG